MQRLVPAVLLAATMLLAAGCSSQPDRWLVGQATATADEVTVALDQHEEWFAADAEAGGWNVQDGAACFLPATEEGDAMIAPPQVWCGPAYTAESADGVPWVVYDVEPIDPTAGFASEPIAPVPADAPFPAGAPDDVAMIRPDGTDPVPSDDATVDIP